MFNHILLSVDGSEHTLRAASLAGDMARSTLAGELHIFVAYKPFPSYLGDPNR